MDIQHCSGCRNDFYNGQNDLGVTKCWSLDSAKLIMRKRVHINQVPPWKQAAQELPHCYHAAKFVFVAPDREN